MKMLWCPLPFDELEIKQCYVSHKLKENMRKVFVYVNGGKDAACDAK